MKKFILISCLLCGCEEQHKATCSVDVAVDVDADATEDVDVSSDVSPVAVASDATKAD